MFFGASVCLGGCRALGLRVSGVEGFRFRVLGFGLRARLRPKTSSGGA